MITGGWNRQERTLIANEFKQFFLHTQLLHFVPLTAAGVMLVLWPYFSSPFVAVMIVLFAGLEPQFNNILFRSPSELESMSIFPIDWECVIRAKNIANLLVTATMLPVIAATILYFSPRAVTLTLTGKALLWAITVVYPLLYVGNIRSVQNPRRETGWQVDDLAGIVEFLISLGVLSLPYVVFTELFDVPVLCFVYAVATFVFWQRYVIRKTVALLEDKRMDICLSK
jgi:hypothetical protein